MQLIPVKFHTPIQYNQQMDALQLMVLLGVFTLSTSALRSEEWSVEWKGESGGLDETETH